jgi:hypothetical protein
MKKVMTIILLLGVVHLAGGLPAFADPRMEINKNFCHFILDPYNTDNEIFVGGCNPDIIVLEIINPVQSEKITESKETTCEENYVAAGYATVTKLIPVEAVPVLPMTSLTITSDESEYPCTMVESNGRAYRSYNWWSSVKAERTTRTYTRVGGQYITKEYVQIVYELYCQEGY